MTIQSESTVSRVAFEHPLATRVFHRYGIEFCCGGGRTLGEACAAQGVDTETVVAEILRELDSSTTPKSDGTRHLWRI